MHSSLEADLWEQAEFEKAEAKAPATLKRPKPKPSIYDPLPEELEYHRQMENSSLVKGYEIVMVRGRPIKVPHERLPGTIEMEEMTRAALREVCPLGSSDEVFLRYLRQEQRTDQPAQNNFPFVDNVPFTGTSEHKPPIQHELPFFRQSPTTGPNYQLNNKTDFPDLK